LYGGLIEQLGHRGHVVTRGRRVGEERADLVGEVIPSSAVRDLIEVALNGRSATGIPLFDEAGQKGVDVTHR